MASRRPTRRSAHAACCFVPVTILLLHSITGAPYVASETRGKQVDCTNSLQPVEKEPSGSVSLQTDKQVCGICSKARGPIMSVCEWLHVTSSYVRLDFLGRGKAKLQPGNPDSRLISPVPLIRVLS